MYQESYLILSSIISILQMISSIKLLSFTQFSKKQKQGNYLSFTSGRMWILQGMHRGSLHRVNWEILKGGVTFISPDHADFTKWCLCQPLRNVGRSLLRSSGQPFCISSSEMREALPLSRPEGPRSQVEMHMHVHEHIEDRTKSPTQPL